MSNVTVQRQYDRMGGRRLALTAALAVLLTGLVGSRTAGAATPDEIMQARPLAPTNQELFTAAAYPDASQEEHPSGPEPTTAEVRERLEAYLLDEFPGDGPAQAAAMALFDKRKLREKVPSPSLRAAVVGLEGTLADGAIDYLLKAKRPNGKPRVTSLRFASEISGTSIRRRGSGNRDARFAWSISENWRAEDPLAITPWLVPAATYPTSGTLSLLSLRLANTALTGLFHLEQLETHPELATNDTLLSRVMNTRSLALFNSGTGGTIGLYESNGDAQVLPGSPTRLYTNWFDYGVFLAADFDAEDGGVNRPVMEDYLTAIGATGCPSSANAQLVDCIDAAGNGGLTAAQLAATAALLQLDLPD